MRIGGVDFLWTIEADFAKQSENTLAALTHAEVQVCAKDFGNLRSDGQDGIQGQGGVLRD
jgi:hypothetical protein